MLVSVVFHLSDTLSFLSLVTFEKNGLLEAVLSKIKYEYRAHFVQDRKEKKNSVSLVPS